MELTDSELAIRWWSRRTINELIELTGLTENEINEISYDSKIWFWKKQQSL